MPEPVPLQVVPNEPRWKSILRYVAVFVAAVLVIGAITYAITSVQTREVRREIATIRERPQCFLTTRNGTPSPGCSDLAAAICAAQPQLCQTTPEGRRALRRILAREIERQERRDRRRGSSNSAPTGSGGGDAGNDDDDNNKPRPQNPPGIPGGQDNSGPGSNNSGPGNNNPDPPRTTTTTRPPVVRVPPSTTPETKTPQVGPVPPVTVPPVTTPEVNVPDVIPRLP